MVDARPLAILLVMAVAVAVAPVAARPPSVATVQANDNTRAAGILAGGALTVALRAATGHWRPEGPSGPVLEIDAFGEVGKALTVPAPLLRVSEGTTIAVTVRNELAHQLVVHGLCARGGAACAPLTVPPGETRDVGFVSGPAGTYHYWASTVGAPVPFRELAGAFVVDPVAATLAPDRILVITEWTSLDATQLREILSADVPTEAFVQLAPRLTFVINGLSWPATERFSYERGERVRWRVINLSSQPHPLHLHGFYFEVTSLGDGLRDTTFEQTRRRQVVTQLLAPGATMAMTWTAERAGNWLFHCHVLHHVSSERRLGGPHPSAQHDAGAHGAHAADASAGMAGMVIGVNVREPRPTAPPAAAAKAPARAFTVSLQPAPRPTIVLERGQPVEITLVNELRQPTAIHWHGIELDSFYDGVHGWSGAGRRITPIIPPGGTFVVRFTPPRAGTFIYHTHLHDYDQLTSGLYGALVVVNPDETFDAATDHVVVIGRTGLTSDEASILTDPNSVVINGVRSPRLVWSAGQRHRVRVINITPDDIFSVTLQGHDGPVTWTPLAKDGATVPASEAAPGPARQTIAVGETYDFAYEAPTGRRTLWLEVRTPGGKWQAQGQVIVR
jgi:FtsP/CotA-like multicopper oxidase with cupredoxin domain